MHLNKIPFYMVRHFQSSFFLKMCNLQEIVFLIGNDLETSEVLYSALLNPKNADFKCKGSGLVWIIIILVL